MPIDPTAHIVEVIMPVGSNPDFRIKQRIFESCAARAGFTALFPSYDIEEPFSVDEYVQRIGGARLVIADLTGERPSCYYELGVAEALDLPTYLIAAEGTGIHQCNGRSAVQFYRSDAELERMVFDALTRAAGRRIPAAIPASDRQALLSAPL